MSKLVLLVAALIASAAALSPADQASFDRYLHHQKVVKPPSPKSFEQALPAASTPDPNAPNPRQPANPVIAIVDVKCSGAPAGSDANSCLDDYYVRWLEAQGTRVVALPIWWPWEQKKLIMDGVNGVLFPGGGEDGQAFTDYIGNATEIINYAIQHPGFFVWGTCQGFQVISIVLNKGDQSILTCDYVGTDPSMLPLDFTDYQPKSTLFGKEAEQLGIVHVAKTTNSTLNFHQCGVHPDLFKPTLIETNVISTNVDLNGKPFTSSLEVTINGINIFATQFHPERPPYEFSNNIITHERGTLDLSTYISRFINERLKLNSNAFSDQNLVNSLTFDNYLHTYDGWGGGYYWMKL